MVKNIKEILKPVGASILGTIITFNLTCSPLENKLNAELPKEKVVKFTELPEEEIKEYNRMLGLVDEISNINGPYCFTYNRVMAELLSGSVYTKTSYAWDLHKKNKVVKRVKGSLENYRDYLKPFETIVLFKNFNSKRNRPNRIGTHTALYYGNDEKGNLLFSHKYGKDIRLDTDSKLREMNIIPKLIFKPKYVRKNERETL